jgi:hypothetical protein
LARSTSDGFHEISGISSELFQEPASELALSSPFWLHSNASMTLQQSQQMSGYTINEKEFAGFCDTIHQHIDAVDTKLMHQLNSL